MSTNARWTGRLITMAAFTALSAGAVHAQPQGGGSQLPPPQFDPALTFAVGTPNPYGLAAADILDANGDPGQDGYPEIAVCGTGVNLFSQLTYCTDSPADPWIRIYHNKGASVRWDGTDGPDPDNDPDDPHDALELVLSINVANSCPGLWPTEIAFADVTGSGDPDLVLVGLDPDNASSHFGRLVVYENLGNGSFDTTPAANITTSVPLRAVVADDFDLDGDIDVIAAASNLPADWSCVEGEQDSIVVFANMLAQTQNFSFAQPPATQDLGVANDAAPADIASGDFYAYAPGTPLFDLATPNLGANSVTALTNLGNLSFDPDTIDPPTGCAWPYATLTAAKFGANSDWDFAAVDADDLFVDVFSGDGEGSFQSTCSSPYHLYPTGPYPLFANGIESGKIDNGPYPDIVVSLGIMERPAGDQPDWYGAVGILLGKGDGTMQSYSASEAYIFRADNPNDQNQPGAAGSVNVLVVDLDADGFDDIVIANHLYDGNNHTDTISVLVNALEVSGTGP